LHESNPTSPNVAPPDRREVAGLACFLLALGAWFTATLRPADSFIGDDFAGYILHAKNLALGRDYAATGYLYNPRAPKLGPPAYPPVLPLFLAPVYRLSGGSMWALKFEMVLFTLALLAVVYVSFRRWLRPAEAGAVVLLLGANPYTMAYKDLVLSDVPFCLFTFLCLELLERLYGERRGRRGVWGYAGVVLAFYLAYGTRTVGVFLLPVIGLYGVWRERRVSAALVGTLAAACLTVVVQGLFIQGARGYVDQFHTSLGVVKTNTLNHLYALSLFWDNGGLRAPRHILMAVASLLAAAGFVWKVRRQPSSHDLFLAVYAVPLLIWPGNQGIRFLLPLLPLYLLYLVLGFRWLVGARLPRLAPALGAAGVATALVSFLGEHRRLAEATDPATMDQPDAAALFEFVRTQTPDDARIVFAKPRALALFTGRAGGIYPPDPSPEELSAYVRAEGMTHLIIPDLPVEPMDRDREFLERYVRGGLDGAELVYQNPHFEVYRLRQERE
jgi:hypothetical protein